MPDLDCPSCGIAIVAGLDANGQPQTLTAGVVILCTHCQALSIVTMINTLRLPTTSELDELLMHPEVTHGIATLAEHHRRHGAPKAI